MDRNFRRVLYTALVAGGLMAVGASAAHAAAEGPSDPVTQGTTDTTEEAPAERGALGAVEGASPAGTGVDAAVPGDDAGHPGGEAGLVGDLVGSDGVVRSLLDADVAGVVDGTLGEDGLVDDLLTGASSGGPVEPGPVAPSPVPGTDGPGTIDPPDLGDPEPEAPGPVEPGPVEPRPEAPGTDEPSTDEPGPAEPGTNEPGAGEPDADRPGSDRPGSGRSGTGAGRDRPGTDDRDAGPRADRPGQGDPAADRAGRAEPGATGSRTGYPGAGLSGGAGSWSTGADFDAGWSSRDASDTDRSRAATDEDHVAGPVAGSAAELVADRDTPAGGVDLTWSETGGPVPTSGAGTIPTGGASEYAHRTLTEPETEVEAAQRIVPEAALPDKGHMITGQLSLVSLLLGLGIAALRTRRR